MAAILCERGGVSWNKVGSRKHTDGHLFMNIEFFIDDGLSI